MAGRKTRSLEALKKKRSNLEEREQKIKDAIFEEFKQCLDSVNAFDIDFDIIIGGILEIVETAKAKDKKTEAWKDAGRKFCGRKQRRESEKSRKGENPATAVKKNKDNTEQE